MTEEKEKEKYSEKWHETRLRLPADLYRDFRKALPMHGSFTWFVREAMTLFLQEYYQRPDEVLARNIRELTQALTSGAGSAILSQPEEKNEESQ